MKNYHLAVIGCGNMAQAIIKALTEKHISLDIVVSDVDTQKLDAVKGLARTTSDNADAVKNADFVLLAVKPQIAPEVLKTLDLSSKTVISIMAGVTVSTLKALTRSNKIVRVMPNLNARIFRSFNAYTYTELNADEANFVHTLLSSFGVAARVDENRLDAVTGLTGSSPAFVFMFVKSFVETAISFGFTPLQAREMALAAVIGSAELIDASPESDLETMIDSVCSKGGTTIEGVKYLRAHDFESVVSQAIVKAVERSKELSADK